MNNKLMNNNSNKTEELASSFKDLIMPSNPQELILKYPKLSLTLDNTPYLPVKTGKLYGEWKICDGCREIFPCCEKNGKYCTRECFQINNDKTKNKDYKEFKIVEGFKQINHPTKGRVFEHRHIMEEHLGRRLERGEVVKHKDGDKLNNNLENLEFIPGKTKKK